jgi:hypothetical protein
VIFQFKAGQISLIVFAQKGVLANIKLLTKCLDFGSSKSVFNKLK